MPRATAEANAAKSAVRAKVEPIFAHQKKRFDLFIRTIGLLRAEAKITLANLAYDFGRLIIQENTPPSCNYARRTGKHRKSG